jgi:hypothetical protein
VREKLRCDLADKGGAIEIEVEYRFGSGETWDCRIAEASRTSDPLAGDRGECYISMEPR